MVLRSKVANRDTFHSERRLIWAKIKSLTNQILEHVAVVVSFREAANVVFLRPS